LVYTIIPLSVGGWWWIFTSSPRGSVNIHHWPPPLREIIVQYPHHSPIEGHQLFITPQVLLKYCMVSERGSELNRSLITIARLPPALPPKTIFDLLSGSLKNPSKMDLSV